MRVTLEEGAVAVGEGSDPRAGGVDGLAGVLVRKAQFSTPDHLAELVAEQMVPAGLVDIVMYLADYSQTRLMPLSYHGMPARAPLSMEGSLAGRVFRTATMLTGDPDGQAGQRLWLPLMVGCARTGVLEMTLPEAAGHGMSPALADALRRYADVVAMLVVSRSSFGDALELVRRERPMRLPAEIQWRLLPPAAFETDRIVVAGALEPWDEVGGDAFDYAVNGDLAHLAVFDAMGHGLNSALLSTLAVGTYRHARRAGLDLARSYAAIDEAIGTQFEGQCFVTALLVELDTVTGLLRWIAAGQPPPLLLRRGRLVKTLDAKPATPLGLRLTTGQPPEHREQLEPGDRLLAYTDGVVEARYHGEFFTEQRLADFVVRESASGQPPPEVLRRLVRAVLDHQHGRLQDDVTIMLAEWIADEGRTAPGASAANGSSLPSANRRAGVPPTASPPDGP